MKRNNSHSPHNPYTNRTAKAATYAHSIGVVIVMMLSPGCGPGMSSEGGDSLGETGPMDPVEDGRRQLVEFDCSALICLGRWSGTDLWSPVFPEADIMDRVSIPAPWVCTLGADVDLCIEVDPQGHTGCFWFQDGWAVAVAPTCAVGDLGWLDVGNEMLAGAV